MRQAQFIKKADHQRQRKGSATGQDTQDTQQEHIQEYKEPDNAQATAPIRMTHAKRKEKRQARNVHELFSPTGILPSAGEQ